jgi:hypothetical protein
MPNGYSWVIEENHAFKGQPPDWQESGVKVFGFDEKMAVEEWAYAHDGRGDYTIVGGSDAHVRIRLDDDKPDAPWKEFTVSGHTERAYRACEQKREGLEK